MAGMICNRRSPVGFASIAAVPFLLFSFVAPGVVMTCIAFSLSPSFLGFSRIIEMRDDDAAATNPHSSRSTAAAATFLQASNKKDTLDWREFRAQLVKSEMMQNEKTKAPNDNGGNSRDSAAGSGTGTSNSWAYDAGKMIEPGSIVLSRVESTIQCHDLKQPFFHKCVILVLEHHEQTGTKAVILNRPSNLNLTDNDIVHLNDADNDDETEVVEYVDEDDYEDKISNDDDFGEEYETDQEDETDENCWFMAFGGEISGLFDEHPAILCLHSVETELGRNVSDHILPGMLVTNHIGAARLVEANEAVDQDFYTTYGICNWEPGQLRDEVDRGSWHIVSASAQMIWSHLDQMRNVQTSGNPRCAGLASWQTWMENICKYSDVEHMIAGEEEDSFADLMLKEWANEMLCVDEESIDNDDDDDVDQEVAEIMALSDALDSSVQVGTLLRGSSAAPSPYLLQEQLLHKSFVLIFQDDDTFSVGLILNHVTCDNALLELSNGTRIEVPIRYGGPNDVGDTDADDLCSNEDNCPLLWVHRSRALRHLGIGKPLGNSDNDNTRQMKFWSCTQKQVQSSIELGVASAAEFMAFRGFYVWEKDTEEGASGIMAQVVARNLKPVTATDENVESIWSLLQSQVCLSESTMDDNIDISQRAWTLARKYKGENSKDNDRKKEDKIDDRLVFNSKVNVSSLADTALRNWIRIYLLGNVEYDP